MEKQKKKISKNIVIEKKGKIRYKREEIPIGMIDYQYIQKLLTGNRNSTTK